MMLNYAAKRNIDLVTIIKMICTRNVHNKREPMINLNKRQCKLGH
jgi:hypothetical protein